MHLRSYRFFVVTCTPLKRLKCGKPRLGEYRGDYQPQKTPCILKTNKHTESSTLKSFKTGLDDCMHIYAQMEVLQDDKKCKFNVCTSFILPFLNLSLDVFFKNT